MNLVQTSVLRGDAAGTGDFRQGEYHAFEAAGRPYLYLVGAGAVFEIDPAVRALLDRIEGTSLSHAEMVAVLAARGQSSAEAEELIHELRQVRVIENGRALPAPAPETPPANFPLQALVLNVTNQCNLACTYCYEFGADKIATPQGKPKYMTKETARASVDLLLAESGPRNAVHITFFGGETLMNFPLLRDVVDYANGQAAVLGKAITYSLTTNATLLTDPIIAFLSDNAIGVTVSIDGPAEIQDRHRVYRSGKGSYAVIEPRLRALIASHRTRAVTARVTLTEGVTDVVGIYRHLKDDLGFHEVGFAPVTQSGERDYAIDGMGMDQVLAGFHALADEWLDHALRGLMHGFSNVSETIGELIQGVNKSHPCGAALGLMGVSPSGDLSPCHRFTDADTHTMGHVSSGIDRTAQKDFLDRGHVEAKYDCQTCWARPLCAGGCHHEAFVRYGDTGHANLHYCDWIREWTDRCLHIYGELAARNPSFLERFAERKGL
ncbi:quinohemoprotein amine dehydrogenase maturation protein [Novosphingobium album (ex Liu et al. 2023)]|uniref:Quinohemoprotein amine dehydrogenase maturation protein n=1 Tax=Novosphingobium album (ex Liu et al. 2023) TaxID=3031130 RepID=A0ABT5WUK0_9SPHN|nr:quinohemoprotein amine dehydrogenase maturation protein [Novosphingobium album (ex Liu et al. 2023)]MDE8653581.1 quinohemoprotein amine dehydrogenase maturation protein [Novosphingobium album (ex Liu et al. 2023)]